MGRSNALASNAAAVLVMSGAMRFLTYKALLAKDETLAEGFAVLETGCVIVTVFAAILWIWSL